MTDPGNVTADRSVALISLYDEHVTRVYSYLLRRCGNRSTAEDLTSETFMGALHALRTNPPRQADLPWLLGIARHKLVDHWRRRERAERNLRVVADNAEDPTWQDNLDAGRAADALEGLSAQYRLVLTLRYLDDLPVRGVAELLGRSEHSTESLLARARRAFRAVYEAGKGALDGC